MARKLVAEHGVSAPFAMAMLRNGTTRAIGVQSVTEDSLRLGELVEGLVQSLRNESKRKGMRAAAVCVTGYVTRPESGEHARAILIALESEEGQTRSVAIPFSRGLHGSVLYHDALEQPGRAVILAPDERTSEPHG